jgi:DNA-binding GntR family transcriptional regulator
MSLIINKERLSKQVYSILKEMIANHRFTPGARINIEQLTKELGTSRTPVWEAVHRLIQEGLLTNIPNRGVFMVELTPRIALELYTVREELEGLAARLAVRNIDQKTIARMKKCLGEQDKVVRRKDLVGYSRLDFDFHAMVYEACGNSILQEMLETVKSKMRPIAMHIDLVLPLLYEEHLRILRALESRDAAEAERVFRIHNRHMIEEIKANSDGDSWKNGPGGAAERGNRTKRDGTTRAKTQRRRA